MARTPDWQTAYQAVILEVDNSKLSEKADQAEAEIFSRLLMLIGTADDVEECQAIQHALVGLGTLRKEKLGLHRPGLAAAPSTVNDSSRT